MKINIRKATYKDILKEEITNFISEELSISADVNNATDEVLKLILTGKRLFTYTFFNKVTYYVACTDYLMDNENEDLPAEVDYDTKTLQVNVPKYKTTENTTKINQKVLRHNLQHEIEHIYQATQRGSGEYENYTDLYDFATDVLTGRAIPNKYCKEGAYNSVFYREARKNLAYLIYLAATTEQDAFINELYSDLMANGFYNSGKEAKIYQESNAFNALHMLKNIHHELNASGIKLATYTTMTEEYHKPVSWFLKLANTAIKRLTSKIGKVLVKARKDLKKNTSVHIPIPNSE